MNELFTALERQVREERRRIVDEIEAFGAFLRRIERIETRMSAGSEP